MGKNSVSTFKDRFGASSTFIGGTLSPALIGIVGLSPDHPLYIEGVDVPIQDWNEALWDAARLALALSDPIDPEKLIQTVEMGGAIPPIKIVLLRDLVLTTEGRRRILSARAANKILIKRGTLPDELIELDCVVDKSTDLEVSVRIGNAGRLEDPPYVKAANAARLKCRGKSEEQIAAILEADKNTVGNWLAYAENLDPAMKAAVENGSKAERIPFAVAVVLATNSGKGEHKAQNQALEYLLKSGAKLTGEKGRENAKTVIRAIMSGEDISIGFGQGDAPDENPAGPPSYGSHEDNPTNRSTPPAPSSEPRTAGQSKPPSSRPSGPAITTQSPKMSWPAIRTLAAHLEPSDSDPHTSDADRVAHAIFQVINGTDPTAEGLRAWPWVQSKFHKVVRSGPGILPVTPKAPEMITPLDSVRDTPCPNRMCDRGHDKAKNATCGKCDGYGKIKGRKAG